MLQLRPNCECCDVDLPPHADARICSFECTFCADCCARLKAICPNCGGELVVRPKRPANKLQANPPTRERIVQAGLYRRLYPEVNA